MSGACFAAAAGSVGATGGGGGGPVSPVNSSGKLQADNTVGTSATLNAGFTFTAGRDAILTMVAYGGSGFPSAVTIGGTAATLDAVNTAADASNRPQIWRAQNIAGGTANVVVTVAATAYLTLAVDEWASGVLDASAVDAGTANSAQGTSAAPSVATATTTSQASTVVYAVALALNASAANGFVAPSGYTQAFVEQDASNHESGCGAWKEETTAGVKTSTFAMTSSTWAATTVAYKLA